MDERFHKRCASAFSCCRKSAQNVLIVFVEILFINAPWREIARILSRKDSWLEVLVVWASATQANAKVSCYKILSPAKFVNILARSCAGIFLKFGWRLI